MSTITTAAPAAPITPTGGASLPDTFQAISVLCAGHKTLFNAKMALNGISALSFHAHRAASADGANPVAGFSTEIWKLALETNEIKTLSQADAMFERIEKLVTSARQYESVQAQECGREQKPHTTKPVAPKAAAAGVAQALTLKPAFPASKTGVAIQGAPQTDAELYARYSTLTGTARSDFLRLNFGSLHRAARAADKAAAK